MNEKDHKTFKIICSKNNQKDIIKKLNNLHFIAACYIKSESYQEEDTNDF
jgi:hypothetical protein